MKTISLVILLSMTISAAWAGADVIPVGTYKLTNAFCSNKLYKMTPDEQALVDAIHHVGDTWSDDSFVIETPWTGIWTTTWIMLPENREVKCVTTQRFDLTALPDGLVQFAFSQSTGESKNTPTNPNVDISCAPPGYATESYKIALGSNSVDLYNGEPETAADKCGEYHLHFEK